MRVLRAAIGASLLLGGSIVTDAPNSAAVSSFSASFNFSMPCVMTPFVPPGPGRDERTFTLSVEQLGAASGGTLRLTIDRPTNSVVAFDSYRLVVAGPLTPSGVVEIVGPGSDPLPPLELTTTGPGVVEVALLDTNLTATSPIVITETCTPFDGANWSPPLVRFPLDNTATLTTSFDAPGPQEGLPATLRISASPAPSETMTIGAIPHEASAVAPEDFDAASFSVPIGVGASEGTATMTIADDELSEPTEYFAVELSGIPADRAAAMTVTSSISAVPPTLAVGSVTVRERGDGEAWAYVPVTLREPLTSTASVSYQVVPGAGGPGSAGSSDLVAGSGTLTFKPNVRHRWVRVRVRADAETEDSEQFSVVLTDTSGVSTCSTSGTVTILDANPTPALTVGDIVIHEGDSGTRTAKFVVALTEVAASTVSVQVATSPTSASAGTDYLSRSRTLSFLPGQVRKAFTVPVLADRAAEGDEQFDVVLSSAVGAPVLDAVAAATIREIAPTVCDLDI